MRNLRTFFLFSGLVFTTYIFSQSPTMDWAKSFGGTAEDHTYGNAIDQQGNIYTVGSFMGSVDFDPDTGTYMLNSNGSADIYIQKLNSNGQLVWVKSIGGSGTDEAASVAIDFENNLLITGIFSNTVDFDPSSSSYNVSSAGSYDVFILKLDSNGSFIWCKTIEGTGTDQSSDIDTDLNGNYYISGWFSGTADFNPGLPVTNFSSAGGTYDCFLLKLDTGGNYMWSAQTGGASQDRARSINIDASGNLYCTGTFGGIVDFDPGTGISNLTASQGNVFIQKLDSNGNFLWAKFIAGQNVYSILTDELGNSYTLGVFGSTVDLDPGPNVANFVSKGSFDIFMLKLSESGLYSWAKSFGGTGYDVGYSSSFDKNGNIHTVGAFENTVDFDPNAGNSNLNSNGKWDVFLQTLDTAGNFIFAKNWGNSENDYGRFIITDQLGDLYVSGNYNDSVSFGFSTNQYSLKSNGDFDVFVFKLTICNSDTFVEIHNACREFTWINDKTYYISQDTVVHTLLNRFGCDSIINLKLTITSIDTSITKSGNQLTVNESDASYQWINCDSINGVLTGDTNQTFTTTTSGNFAVIVSKNGCTDTTHCITISNAKIIEKTFLSGVDVYPNPTTSTIIVRLEESLPYIKSIVRNAHGQIINSQVFLNSDTLSLEINGPAGVYFIEILGQNKRADIKVIKTE